MGVRFFEKIYQEAVLCGGLMIKSCKGRGNFTNASSSNVKTVKLKMLPIMKGYILEDKALTVYRIMEVFILEVNS